ncbi:MAG: acyl-CoA desaturase [Cyclobacteriaceae bacterium]|nr:acyl-CoA desaturase [Cyclobacteriaceae bacterium]
MQPFKKVRFVRSDNNQFFTTLKKRINQHFKSTNTTPYGDYRLYVKSIVLLAAYILPFILMLSVHPPFWVQMIAWAVMGFGLAGIGMSIMHDALHGAYSKNSSVNYWMGNTLNLVGASTFNWKLQHNFLHHTWTNVAEVDDDIKNKLILKFSPHTPKMKVHRFQFIYAFFFYGLLTLYWIVAKDFIQFAKYTQSGVNKQNESKNRIQLIKLIALKSLYFIAMIGVPIFVLGFSAWHIIAGFVLMHFIAGNILTLIFQMAHAVDEADHPKADEHGNIYNEWAIHQINTTVNFSRDNKFLSWYLGGLNFQVEHHLFPNISHVHYPSIAPIVKETAEEFGIDYLENKDFMTALKSHIKVLKKVGLPHANEAIV